MSEAFANADREEADLASLEAMYEAFQGQDNGDVGAEGAEQEMPGDRTYAEIVAEARTLTGADLKSIASLLKETIKLPPLEQEAVLKVIKKATGLGMGSLRSQLKEARDHVGEMDHLSMAGMTISKLGRENILCAEGHVWGWKPTGVWAKLDDRAVKQFVQNRLALIKDLPVNSATVTGVTDVLKTEIFAQGHEFNVGNPEVVNCLNGQVELVDGIWQLRPHCREQYRTTQIPVEFDHGAKAPQFERYLDQIFRDDPDGEEKRQCVLEMMGYTLMSHARHERFIMLIGVGANGKSVLLKVLQALVGNENVAGVQPSNFDRTFQRAHLHQKLANIVTELPQGQILADAELKSITSGEPATVEFKHQNPFVMMPFATCWFGTNHMPHTRDFSDALFRRAIILTFNRVFAETEQDPMLKVRLLSELSGILNLALGAYGSALANGFTRPRSSEVAAHEWRLEADQVAQFVEDACERSPASATPAQFVFDAYKVWASANGIARTVSQKAMRERLGNLGFGAKRTSAARLVEGLRLRH